MTLWTDDGLGGISNGLQSAEVFPLVPGSEGPCEWLSDALRENVFLEERVEGGFPDDRDAAGPTVISTETLCEVARWFGWDDAEVRRRFRMNLELTTESDVVSSGESQSTRFFCDAFWEERLAYPLQKMDSVSVSDEGDDPLDYLPVAEPNAFVIGGIEFRPAGAVDVALCRVEIPVQASSSHCFGMFFARRFRGLRRMLTERQDYYRLGLKYVSHSSICRWPARHR